MSKKKIYTIERDKDNPLFKRYHTMWADLPIGGGDSEIFDEYIDATDQQRNTALANVSNQTADSTTGKMGYKVLDPTKTFAEQVIAENTIYEIRDVFDLNNTTVTIPADCILKFNGGLIDNGALIGTKTNIIGGSVKIFGDNLILYQACFKYKTLYNPYTEIITILPWVNYLYRTVRLVTTGRYWKLTTSGVRRGSNKDGIGVFTRIEGDGNDEISFDNDLVLENNPGSFLEIDNSTTYVQFNNTLNGGRLCYINGKKGSVFTIPYYSNFAFFSSNNENDNLNETFIQPGTDVDLSQNSIYVTYLNRCEIDSIDSSFTCDAKLSWFIGNNYSISYDVLDIEDQSRNLQSALDCSMNIISDIRGIIICNKTLCIDIEKKIDLGSRYELSTYREFAFNRRHTNTFTFTSTVIATLSNNDMILQRNVVEFNGGLLTTKFADNHQKNIWVVDGTSHTSESIVKTSMLGKFSNGLFTNAAIYVDDGDCNGFSSFSTFDCYSLYCKYGIYAHATRVGDFYFNTAFVKLICIGYYESVHISEYFGSSQFNLILDATPVVPIAVVDNYRNAYINTTRSTVSIVTWDFSTSKTVDSVQKPYRKILITGTGTITTGNSMNKNEQAYIELSKNYGHTGRDPKLLFLESDTNIYLPKINDCFYGLNTSIFDSSNSYMKIFRVKEGESVDISNLNGSSLNNASIQEVKNFGSVYQWSYMFSSNVSQRNSIEQGDYIELYVVPKNGYSLINSDINSIAYSNQLIDGVDYNANFDKIKIVINGSKVINSDYSNFGFFEIGKYSSVSSLLIRWYYNTNNYGSPEAISNIKPISRLYAFASNSQTCRNWTDQNIRTLPTTALPSSNIIIGEMFYDSTLKKPLWGNSATSFVDSDGFTAMRKSGTTTQREGLSGMSDGYQYYDTTLHKWVYYNGTTWLNLDGTALS